MNIHEYQAKEIFKEYFDYANKYLDEVLKNVG